MHYPRYTSRAQLQVKSICHPCNRYEASLHHHSPYSHPTSHQPTRSFLRPEITQPHHQHPNSNTSPTHPTINPHNHHPRSSHNSLSQQHVCATLSSRWSITEATATGSGRDEAFQRPWRNYIIHELLADWSYLLWQGSAEHHHLFLVGGHFEHLLNISTHVYEREKNGSILRQNRRS